MIKKVAEEARLRSADTSLANNSALPIFFPENAYNPAVPQKLPGDHWWLPSPSDGNRIDLGTRFFAYRSAMNEGTFALWTREPGRYKLDILDPKGVHFRTLDGSDPAPKLTKGGVEVSLTQFPLIITGTLEVPVPDVALLETVQQFKVMLNMGQSSHRQVDEQDMYFNQAIIGFERNPGGSFDQMRRQYWKIADKVASYIWIEAEHYTDSNFSEVEQLPGCSGGQALVLRTPIPPGPGGYFADYRVQVRSKDDLQVWIAAKIPAERRNDVSIVVGGQQMKPAGEPLSIYGGGFGWYRVGTTRIAGNLTTVRLQVDTAGSSEIAVDAILLTPGEFKPNGVTPPDPVSFRSLPSLEKKGSKRRGSGGS